MIHLFFVNSYAGKGRFSTQIREYLSTRTDIEYYIVHTRDSESVSELVRFMLSIFEGEKIRIYSCGGSGTLCRILNGIESFENIEIAFYPKGLTNDFLKIFKGNDEKFKNLEALIDGKPKMVDLIRTNHGVCINSLSVGLDSLHTEKYNKLKYTSIIGRSVPYTLGLINAVFFGKPAEYEIELDSFKFRGKCTQIVLTNGGLFGGNMWVDTDMSPNPADGKCAYVVFDAVHGLAMIPQINLMTHGNVIRSKKAHIGYTSKIRIKRTDGKPFAMSFDGELQDKHTEWNGQVVASCVPFVVPKGVEFKCQI